MRNSIEKGRMAQDVMAFISRFQGQGLCHYREALSIKDSLGYTPLYEVIGGKTVGINVIKIWLQEVDVNAENNKETLLHRAVRKKHIGAT